MGFSDYLILAGVALLITAALRSCVRRRKRGGCSGCSGCSGCPDRSGCASRPGGDKR